MTTQPPYPPQPPAGGAMPTHPMSPADEKMWAVLVHIGGIFFNVVAPLVGYLVLKDRGPFVAAHTKTALNFQITLLIAEIVGWITLVFLIGWLILAAVFVVKVVFSLIAAVRASRGQWYLYPPAVPFLR